MILLVWESREAADRWVDSAEYRKFLEDMHPNLSGDVIVTFFNLEGVGCNYHGHDFNPVYIQIEEVTGTEQEAKP